jgi:hypothetical protein
VRNSCVEGTEVKCFNTIAGGEWLKIKFYLLGIAARPTEKLAAQIILFAFQTLFFIKKKSKLRRNFDRVRGFFPGFIYFKSRS